MAKKTYKKKYMVGDEQVPGVTTVIKTSLGWGMGALIGWAVKVTKEGKDHRNIMEDAADAGVLAHTLVERYCNDLLHKPNEDITEALDGYSDEQVISAKNALAAFMKWREGNKLEIIHSEIEVVCKTYKYGGSIDLVFKDEEGGIHICDVKTTNYLLPDHLIQVAAYGNAYQEQYPMSKVVAAHLLRFNKGPETTFHHTYWSIGAMALGFQAFVNLRELYNLKKRVGDLC
jgi:hypothetical protein